MDPRVTSMDFVDFLQDQWRIPRKRTIFLAMIKKLGGKKLLRPEAWAPKYRESVPYGSMVEW